MDLAKAFIKYGSDLNRLSLTKVIFEYPNDKNLINLLLLNGISLEKLYEGKSPVWAAYELSRPDLLIMLAKAGADMNVFNSQGRSLLHDACWKGKMYYVKVLLKYKADCE